MVSSWDLGNTVLSIISVAAIVGQFTYWVVMPRLPRARLRALEATLNETQTLLDKCIEEGRLKDATEIAVFNSSLRSLRDRACGLRVETLSAKTFSDHVRNMKKNLSRRMLDLCQEVRLVQTDISISSAASLAQTNRTQTDDMACEEAGPSEVSDVSTSCTRPSTPPSSLAPPAVDSTGTEADPTAGSLPPPVSCETPAGSAAPLSEAKTDVVRAGTHSSSSTEDGPFSDYHWSKPLLRGNKGKFTSSSKTSPVRTFRRKKLSALLS